LRVHPAVRTIVAGADGKFSGVDVFKSLYKLQELSKLCHAQLDSNMIDVLITPTSPCNYTVEEMQKDPVKLNSNMGKYTNYMNFLDLCGVAVPLGGSWQRKSPNAEVCDLPFGVTLAGRGGEDEKMLKLAETIESASKA
jgi:allophanate hydrolase